MIETHPNHHVYYKSDNFLKYFLFKNILNYYFFIFKNLSLTLLYQINLKI
jgi:hypothetical protein